MRSSRRDASRSSSSSRKAAWAERSELNGARIARLDPGRLPDAVRELGGFWVEPRAPDEAVAAVGRRILDQLLGSAPPASSLDHRITRAIEWILPRIEEPLTLGQAADVACLSESRFSHLFVEETGLPFRTWVLWRRLMRSVERMAAGETLTSAALQAGFSDSAHFSRTFLRMFGVQASALGLVYRLRSSAASMSTVDGSHPDQETHHGPQQTHRAGRSGRADALARTSRSTPQAC